MMHSLRSSFHGGVHTQGSLQSTRSLFYQVPRATGVWWVPDDQSRDVTPNTPNTTPSREYCVPHLRSYALGGAAIASAISLAKRYLKSLPHLVRHWSDSLPAPGIQDGGCVKANSYRPECSSRLDCVSLWQASSSDQRRMTTLCMFVPSQRDQYFQFAVRHFF